MAGCIHIVLLSHSHPISTSYVCLPVRSIAVAYLWPSALAMQLLSFSASQPTLARPRWQVIISSSVGRGCRRHTHGLAGWLDDQAALALKSSRRPPRWRRNPAVNARLGVAGRKLNRDYRLVSCTPIIRRPWRTERLASTDLTTRPHLSRRPQQQQQQQRWRMRRYLRQAAHRGRTVEMLSDAHFDGQTSSA